MNTSHECYECNGAGWVSGHFHACDGRCIHCPTQEQCRVCEGTGQVNARQDAACCDVSGRPCDRKQPFKIFYSDCWMISGDYTENEDGTFRTNDLHQLPDSFASEVVMVSNLKPILALLNVADESPYPKPAQISAARRRLAELIGMSL